MFKLLTILILSFTIVQCHSFIRTTFDLGSNTGLCINAESTGSWLSYDSVLLRTCNNRQTIETEELEQRILFQGVGPISVDNGKSCLEAKSRGGGWNVNFRPCWSTLQEQNFTFISKGCMIKSVKLGYCIAAGSTLAKSGESLTRTLEVVDCEVVSGKLLSWDIHTYDDDTKLECDKPRSGWVYPKWAAVIFTIFGIISCWCACHILFCSSFCKDKQSVRGFTLWKRERKPFNDNLLCPAGHKLRRVINQGTRNCSWCVEVEITEGTEVYTCIDCDLTMCHFCYQRDKSSTTSEFAAQSVTPKRHRTKIRLENDDSYVHAPLDKFDSRVSSARGVRTFPQRDNTSRNRTPGCTECIMSVCSKWSPHDKDYERSAREIRSINSPERILDDLDRIRNVVKALAKVRSRSVSPGGCRSPRDYTPRRRRRSRGSRMRSVSSLPSWSEGSDISPYRRRRRGRRYR